MLYGKPPGINVKPRPVPALAARKEACVCGAVHHVNKTFCPGCGRATAYGKKWWGVPKKK